jgi:hypothetical protein
VDNDQDAAKRIGAKGNEASLIRGIRVFDSHGQRIAQGLLGVSEADPVLLEIGCGLGWIEFDLHAASMHVVCMPVKVLPDCAGGAAKNYPMQRNDALSGRGPIQH